MTRLLTLLLAISAPTAPTAPTAHAAPASPTPPTDGLVLWLDAADKSTHQTTGPTITRWADKSGQNHHAEGPTGPTTITEENTHLIRFGSPEGKATTLNLPTLRTTPGSWTLFTVARRTPEQSGKGHWQRLIAPINDNAKEDREPFRMVLPPHQGKPDAFPLALYTRTVQDSSPTPLTLGGTLHQGLQGDLAELLIYDRTFTDPTDYEKICDYLCAKWKVNTHKGQDGWERHGPIPPAIPRTAPQHPLIDQANKHLWQPHAPLSDDFDSPTLDTAKWWDHHPEWYGRPPAIFLPENITVKDGELQLTIRKDPTVTHFKPYKEAPAYEGYSAAAMSAKTNITYGCFEVRVQTAKIGATSSFWFCADADDARGQRFKNEIDCFELPYTKGHEHNYGMNMHVFKEANVENHWSNWGNWHAPFIFSEAFHTMTLIWSPDWIRYYVDGHPIRTTRNVAWHIPLRMIFDMEIMDWLPRPPDTDFPKTYRIDYVKAWNHPAWKSTKEWKSVPAPSVEIGVGKTIQELRAIKKSD